ncbi:MAG TPA: hypothetical protein VM661_12940 [Candidatus Sulfotelmatobacter sp.]|jgi:hypothetical protein|nr:hypothetical protein [Candidatus Sulfotelmatobacter sp.]
MSDTEGSSNHNGCLVESAQVPAANFSLSHTGYIKLKSATLAFLRALLAQRLNATYRRILFSQNPERYNLHGFDAEVRKKCSKLAGIGAWLLPQPWLGYASAV